VPPDPEHSLRHPDQPCGGDGAATDRRPALSSHVGGCSTGNACPSMVVERIVGGPTDEALGKNKVVSRKRAPRTGGRGACWRGGGRWGGVAINVGEQAFGAGAVEDEGQVDGDDELKQRSSSKLQAASGGHQGGHHRGCQSRPRRAWQTTTTCMGGQTPSEQRLRGEGGPGQTWEGRKCSCRDRTRMVAGGSGRWW
jgi:hypothetical protein